MSSRMLIVVSVAPSAPEDLPAILKAINPPAVPYFSGDVRVVPEVESVDAVLAYLDDDEGPIADTTAVRDLVNAWRQTADETTAVSPQMAVSAGALAFCADALEQALGGAS